MVRPGLRLLRRDLRTWQLGVEWPGVAALVDSPSVQAVLAGVDGFRDVDGVVLAAEARGVPAAGARAALDALLESGFLVDQAEVKPPSLDRATWTALWLLAGPRTTAAALHRSRLRTAVYVDGTGRIAAELRRLVAEEQLTQTRSPDRATVVVLATDQEPSRAAADDALRRGVPFLCVGLRELVGLVGPFVVPGRTACLRCVDLGRAERDPSWRILVESLQRAAASEPSATASLVATVAGYAAQEIALWASGAQPVSCDHVVEIPHGLGEVQTVGYQPHPQCGCSWQSGQGTMGA
jgi:bacteriocin biosynthesis cyclodehydratase domain-containing protein